MQTRSQARSSGIKLLEVHNMGKNLDPNIKPEKQHSNSIKGGIEKPHICQHRAGLKRKRPDPINQTTNPPNLGNYSPYELIFGRKPRPLLNLDSNPDIKVSRMFKEYYELLNKRLKYLHDILLNF